MIYNLFLEVISTVSKLSKTCALRLTKDKLFFILTERLISGGISLWCELSRVRFSGLHVLHESSRKHPCFSIQYGILG